MPTESPQPALEPGQVAIMLVEGSVGRYRVKAQFARLNLPSEAVGETSEVRGVMLLGAEGTLLPSGSELVVNPQSLKCHERLRDNYLRRSAIGSNRFPESAFVIHETPGLSWLLPTSGETSFQLAGSMTVQGVTKPLVWELTVKLDGGRVTGKPRPNSPLASSGWTCPTSSFS